jgi:antitoxin ParD1/3/4
MHISQTPDLEELMKSKVASGLHNNASEVVREALRHSLLCERENQWIAREAAIGFAQLEAVGRRSRFNPSSISSI